VAILASFVASVLLAVVRERLRPGYRTAEQVASSIGATALGSVPKVGNPRKALRFTGRHSAFSESIFSIRALLRLNLRVGPKVILVTSALPREGKTFLSSSLARNAALAGERTLLIDCDLRRPAVARNIDTTDLRALDGITIRRDGLSCLDVITLPRDGISPQDFFASVAMRDMIEMLRKHYDMIVLDAPPVLAVSDARVLSRLADATVLVVRWQKTPEAFVTAAASALRAGGTWVAGAVLTQVRLRDLTASEGGHAYVYQKYSKYLTT
jgi:capsular exopolysaccharide synthesis family protein